MVYSYNWVVYITVYCSYSNEKRDCLSTPPAPKRCISCYTLHPLSLKREASAWWTLHSEPTLATWERAALTHFPGAEGQWTLRAIQGKRTPKQILLSGRQLCLLGLMAQGVPSGSRGPQLIRTLGEPGGACGQRQWDPRQKPLGLESKARTFVEKALAPFETALCLSPSSVRDCWHTT